MILLDDFDLRQGGFCEAEQVELNALLKMGTYKVIACYEIEDRVDRFIEWRWKYSPNCAKFRCLGKDRDLAASLIWESEDWVPDGLRDSQGKKLWKHCDRGGGDNGGGGEEDHGGNDQEEDENRD